MADKNRNGIDDKYETSYGRRSPGDNSSPSIVRRVGDAKEPEGINAAWQSFLQGPVRGVSNFAGSIGAFLSGQAQPAKGANAGDQMFGVPRAQGGTRSRVGGGTFGPAPEDPGADVAPQLSLLDYLSQAGGIVDQLGIGQGGGTDYSGAMAQARANRDRNSAYLSALYGQLRGGLAEDRKGIATNYGGAIDQSQDIAATAQASTRAAYDAAQARQDQAASALGMQAAAASQELDRPTTQQLAADAIGDSARYAQNAQEQYNSQQANATTHSTNVTNASRFAETNAQNALEASLSDRLSELAQMQAESQRSGQSERASAILSLAQSLYGDAQNTSQQDFENQLAVAEAEADRLGSVTAPQYTLEQLMQGQQDSGLNNQDYISLMKLLAQLNG